MFQLIRNLANTGSNNPAQWLIDWFRDGPESDSGVNVDVHSALGLSPLWYAVSTIAGHVGTLPFHVHRRVEGGSELAMTHPLYRILKTRPNEYQTAITFKEQLMLHALLLGNGRAAIIRRGGMPVELIPILPQSSYTCMVEGEKWHVVQVDVDERLNYEPINPSTTIRDGRWYKIHDDDVFHVPGLGYDGISGKNLIKVAKDAIGLGLAGQKAASRAFRNGGKPGVVIEAPNGVFRDEKDAKEFIDRFNAYHEGLDNFGRAALMREGMKLSTLQVSASDAEWVAQRKFQRQEIALLFGIQSLPGDEESVSYSSLEQKNIAYLQNCLTKWLVKWEQEADHKLLGRRSSRTHFTKFNIDALLRSDSKTRMETLTLGVINRIYSPNEARAFLDMLPYEGGDEFANPAITPGAGDSEQDEQEDQDEGVSNQERRLAIQSQFERLIGVEAKRVARHARFVKAGKNFIPWLEEFYGGQWLDTMTETTIALGGNETLAQQHCEASYSELLEITGCVTPDGLSEAITEVVETWPQRATLLTEQLLKGEMINV